MMGDCNWKSKRFSRQIAFSAFGQAGQAQLARSRALVVGVGGLGSWAAELLVRAGVGAIRICDDDCVELSNLHRQALYAEVDAVQVSLKTQAAAARLRALNSDCQVEPFCERIDRLTIHRVAKGVDVIVDATDNFETRFLIMITRLNSGCPGYRRVLWKGKGK